MRHDRRGFRVLRGDQAALGAGDGGKLRGLGGGVSEEVLLLLLWSGDCCRGLWGDGDVGGVALGASRELCCEADRCWRQI